MKLVYLFLSLSIFTASCSSKMTNLNEVSVFLNAGHHKKVVDKNNEEIEFWRNRLNSDTGSYIYKYQIAQHFINRFSLLGNPSDLLKADSLLMVCKQKTNAKEPNIFYALIQNAITQHKFKTANNYLEEVVKLGGDVYVNNLLSFDVNMELGKYEDAEIALAEIGSKSSNFDYLIRSSKLLDHQGKAEVSMKQMEKAFELAQKNANDKQVNWCITNLADKYSHEGEIEKAYSYYIKSLKADSANLYALKGIAKIFFVHDKDFAGAKAIINFIQTNGIHPDNNLLLSEIADEENDKLAYEKNINDFNRLMSNYDFGQMYNKYKIELLADDKSTIDSALSLANAEIQNRATPETYALLALTLNESGNNEKAVSIFNEFVFEKTAEPDANFVQSILFAKVNRKLGTTAYKECLKSKFELGPKKIKLLKSLYT